MGQVNTVFDGRRLALASTKALIRTATGALVLAIPLSWVGFKVSHGLWAYGALGAGSAAFYLGSMIVTKKILGVPKGTCPMPKTQNKLFLQAVVASFAQLLLFRLLPFVTVTHWWTVIAGGPIVLLAVSLSNIPTKFLDSVFAKSE